jgi:hypothetical protein
MNEEQPDFKKIGIATIVAIFLLSVIVYGGYQYSVKKQGQISLPRGDTYLGKEGQNVPPTAPQVFTVDAKTPWITYTNPNGKYAFNYPSTLNLVIFPGDVNESVAFAWGNIYAQNNILANLVPYTQRNDEFKGFTLKQFVENYYKLFDGLTGLKSATEFTNTNGLKGYKAYYINTVGQTPNLEIFFEIPGSQDLLHFANGVIDPKVFDRIVDSAQAPAPTPKKS